MFAQTNGYSLSDIAAVSGANNGRNNDGFMGDGAWWIIILFLFCFMGWGDNGFGGFGNRGGGTNGGGVSVIEPALTRGELCSEFSFNDLQNGVRGVSDSVNTGFANLNSTICHQQYDTATMINGLQSNIASGFAGVDNAICTLGYQNAGLINGLENVINSNANAANIMALQNQNALQTQLAQCCCDTKSMFADTKYTMATDTCAIQTSMANNTRDIIDSQNANTKAILDFLTQDKIADLTAENQTLKFAASQSAQNAYLVNALKEPCPVPAYFVPNPNANYFPYLASYNGYGFGNGCCCNN